MSPSLTANCKLDPAGHISCAAERLVWGKGEVPSKHLQDQSLDFFLLANVCLNIFWFVCVSESM